MTHRLIFVFLLLVCIAEARVDFEHSQIFDEYDFKGQSSIAITGLCADSCRIYASITPESKAFTANLLIQAAKGFLSVADVAGRVDSATNHKLYLEINNTVSLTIVNANSKQAGDAPLVLYVVNQAASYYTHAEIYEAEGFYRPQWKLLEALTVISARPFTLTQARDIGQAAGSEQGVLAQMTGFDALIYKNITAPCPYLYYVLYGPFPGFTMEVNGPIISLLYDVGEFTPPGDLNATLGISNNMQLERSGWIGSPGYHGCANKEPFRSSLYDFSTLFQSTLTSDQPESLTANITTNTDDNHPVIVTQDGFDEGFSDISVTTSFKTNLTILWKPDNTGNSHFLIRWNSTIVPT